MSRDRTTRTDEPTKQAPSPREIKAEQRREDRAEQQAMSARHRPDERAPNDPAGPPGSGAGDRHAAGAIGGGSAVGGLAGTNVGDGSPENADIDAAAGSSQYDIAIDADEEDAYSGFSGGAVGGSPAGKRVGGGRATGGIAPGGSHRGDTTIGSDPDSP